MKKQTKTDKSAQREGEVILLVDDDVDLRSMVATMLQSLGYNVRESATVENALAILEESPDVDLLLTDVVLSGGASGRTLAERTKAKYPNLPVLFMTGYTEDTIIYQGWAEGDVHLLQKPFRRADLARAVRNALDNGRVNNA